MSGVFKPWWEREAEGDTSTQVKRQRAAANAWERYQETGSSEDYRAWRAEQDDLEAYWKED